MEFFRLNLSYHKGGFITLPDERYRAVRYAREFLRDLLDPKATPKVPSHIRRQAYWVLRHFPGESDMMAVSDGETFEYVKEVKETD